MSARLPALPASTDKGHVYVVRRGDAYKIGFSRASVDRRVRDAAGELVLTLPTGQHPSQLEHAIHHRFRSKRLADAKLHGREWFLLDAADLEWPQGLATYLRST